MTRRQLIPILPRYKGKAILSILLIISFAINVLVLVSSSYSSLVFRDNSHDAFCTEILKVIGDEQNALDDLQREILFTNHRADQSMFGTNFIRDVWRCLYNDQRYNITENLEVDDPLQNSVQRNGGNETDPYKFDIWEAIINNITGFKPNDGVKSRADPIWELLTRPIINPHTYPFIHNQPKACVENGIQYILAVPSFPTNFKNRQKVRQHQTGQFARNLTNRVRLLFFLGNVPQGSKDFHNVQKQIDQESQTHQDIIQCDFIESFRNMTIKASLILRWSVSHCTKSIFVLRMDDDLRANLPEMSRAMKDYSADSTKNPHFILGQVAKDWGPVRKKNKYYTSWEEYPYTKLPPFILGGTMGYSVETADLLFMAYQRLKLFFLEDVFISAMCASKAGVSIYHNSAFQFEHWKW